MEPRKPLTEMQFVVGKRVGGGATYAEVAQALSLSPSTVRVHVHAISQLLPNPKNLAPWRHVFLWSSRYAWPTEYKKAS